MKKTVFILIASILFLSCTKDKGVNPELAYGDRALFDSTKNTNYTFYKNKDTLWAGNHGPHGPFKLRFNSIAYKLLTDSGRIPKNKKFIDGSFVVKDIYSNGSITLHAYMYKRNGVWLWGEAYGGVAQGSHGYWFE